MENAETDAERVRELAERNRQLEAENREQKRRLTEQEKPLAEREKTLAEREKTLADQAREIERTRKEIDDLKTALARAQRTSQNSSKRPSSDIVKPHSARRVGGRKIGGQAGHPLHKRAPFQPEEIDAVIEHTLAC